MGNLHALKPASPQEPRRAFRNYGPGFVRMDVKCLSQMQDESRRHYLFVAIKANKSKPVRKLSSRPCTRPAPSESTSY